MSVNTQVSGNKIHTIQASKNLGTVINTQVSGDKVNATYEYRKITNVKPTQVSGERHLTNYTGINSEGTNIFENKNTVNETETVLILRMTNSQKTLSLFSFSCCA